MNETKLCDCPYNEFCHLPRQHLQLLFRKRDEKRTILDCEFHQAIKEVMIGSHAKMNL